MIFRQNGLANVLKENATVKLNSTDTTNEDDDGTLKRKDENGRPRPRPLPKVEYCWIESKKRSALTVKEVATNSWEFHPILLKKTFS